jgi:hypothetical protein
MSSQESDHDHISSEKQVGSPNVAVALATAAVPASEVPRVKGKEKEVYNVRFGHTRRSVAIAVLLTRIGRALRRDQGGQHRPLEQDIPPPLL